MQTIFYFISLKKIFLSVVRGLSTSVRFGLPFLSGPNITWQTVESPKGFCPVIRLKKKGNLAARVHSALSLQVTILRSNQEEWLEHSQAGDQQESCDWSRASEPHSRAFCLTLAYGVSGHWWIFTIFSSWISCFAEMNGWVEVKSQKPNTSSCHKWTIIHFKITILTWTHLPMIIAQKNPKHGHNYDHLTNLQAISRICWNWSMVSNQQILANRPNIRCLIN